MDWIKIGDGGGFTGKETVYTINTQNGSIESEGRSFQKLVWNPSDQNVPKDIHLIYDHLNHLVQKASK